MDESNSSSSVAPTTDELHISDMIDITVKTIDSKNFQFNVENDILIKALKEKVAPQVGIEVENQRMIFCGRVLSDDKSLKDYNIDNGKVIHLVKRAAPKKDNGSTNANANQQQNSNSTNPRYHSYRSEDGSFMMGTISLDSPSNLINQMVRQIFTGNRGSASSSSGSGTATASATNESSNANANETVDPNSRHNLRNRINYIRRFMGFINTNFQILENPNQFPQSLPEPENLNEQQVLSAEFIELFTEANTYQERIRPHLTNFFQSIASQPTPAQLETIQGNYSILMRISHHLSHVMHLLTEFNIDFTSENMPLVLNTLDSPANNTSHSSEGGMPPGMTARIEISTSVPTMNSLPTGMSMPAGFSPSPGSFFNPSPIVLMEVDTNVSVSRNLLQGLRGIPGMQGLNLENLLSQIPTSNSTNSSTTQSNSDTSASSTTLPDNLSTNNSASTTEASNSAANASSTSTTTSASTSISTSTSTTTSSSTNASSNSAGGIPFNFTNNVPTMSVTFDPFLTCNSTYTIPEVRSATHLNGGVPTMRRVFTTLGSRNPESTESQTNANASSNNQSSSNINNPLFAGLNGLIRNMDNSSPQSSDEFEFFDLIRFLINQINLNTEDLPDELNNEPRIGDYLRSLNLVNPTDNQSIISDFFSLIFQNLGFEDLLNVLNHDFRGFTRFREPLQNFIRNHLLPNGGDLTVENIRNEISNFLTANHDSLITILANIPTVHGVDSIESFQNFIKGTLTNFFNIIMQSTSDENFANEFLAAITTLVASYIQFCKVCFTETDSMSQLITNYFEQYASYLNPRIQQFMNGILIDRVRSFAAEFVVDEETRSRVQQYIVHPATEAVNTPAPMETSTEPDRQSISNDSEFSDAISEFPSTSSAPKLSTDTNEPQNWQSIMPSEWVPIITEDINKQKNIDPAHQPPFSDAYLSGMPKKRRLEHKPEDDDKPEPKLRSKPQ